jgi:hypothetical protein
VNELPELPELVAYTIASELGPDSPRGSAALASAVSAVAAEVIFRSPRPDPAELRDFHGIAAQRLRSLGLLASNETFQAELARVGQALAASRRP